MRKYLIVVTGPTGIGKTKAAIEMARNYHTEIVSADSRQIFNEMKTGTAVPDDEELRLVQHHFIQTHSISESYNASKYETEALNLLDDLFKRHHIVLLVGGSMLYIDAVCKGIDIMPDADPEIRKALKTQFEREGLDGLRLQLKQLDPVYYQTVDLKNPNRIIHALEISIMTGRPYSSFRENTVKNRPFSILKIGLNCDREKLHQKINSRVDQMVMLGLEDEARKLYPLKHLNALNTVGYREWFDYFDGLITKEKAIELIKRNSRRYARKQITWFRNDPDVTWFEPGETKQMIAFIDNKLKQ